MADTTKLKKGAPPQRHETVSILATDAPSDNSRKKALQFVVPENVFEEFSLAAGQQFGFAKGSKSKLFLAMWQNHKS